jgi:hypothetical protein
VVLSDPFNTVAEIGRFSTPPRYEVDNGVLRSFSMSFAVRCNTFRPATSSNSNSACLMSGPQRIDRHLPLLSNSTNI